MDDKNVRRIQFKNVRLTSSADQADKRIKSKVNKEFGILKRTNTINLSQRIKINKRIEKGKGIEEEKKFQDLRAKRIAEVKEEIKKKMGNIFIVQIFKSFVVNFIYLII